MSIDGQDVRRDFQWKGLQCSLYKIIKCIFLVLLIWRNQFVPRIWISLFWSIDKGNIFETGKTEAGYFLSLFRAQFALRYTESWLYGMEEFHRFPVAKDSAARVATSCRDKKKIPNVNFITGESKVIFLLNFFFWVIYCISIFIVFYFTGIYGFMRLSCWQWQMNELILRCWGRGQKTSRVIFCIPTLIHDVMHR